MHKLKLGVFCLWMSLTAEAHPKFPTSPYLERKVRFWERVFAEFKSHQIVIHDRFEPNVVVGVIDLPDYGYDNPLDPEARTLLERQLKLYNEALDDFHKQGAEARRLSPRHRKIWQAYRQEPTARQRLLAGETSMRSQGGLADTFRQAADNARLYLPRMERIFRAHGLPPELTRMVFVESMFNLNARSKVGASGFWQLMPETARAYLKVNRKIDQRNSPFLATEAAAKILKNNHAVLKSWPLAITAYNHGLNGMKRAVAQTGTRDLHTIVTSYESPSFGFASRNFYAEFVAAKRIYEKHKSRQASKDLAKER
jgi:membrane-bound lytic murein transglycosylase D